jgi:hypothetical protein
MVACTRAFLLFSGLFLFVAAIPSGAQIHGVPASVTSFGFGGSNSFTPGVAASVTSLGPNGFGHHARFGNCCFTPFFQNNFQPSAGFRRRHSHRGFAPFFATTYAIPYPQVVVVQPESGVYDDEDYEGGPTIFDRRGSRARRPRAQFVEPEQSPPPQSASSATPPEPVASQPSTLLVFRDGHQTELQNYAIVGDTIFDLAENRSHKIQIADLDLAATRKVNDERGVDFQVPSEAAR